METIQFSRKSHPMYFKKSDHLGHLIRFVEKEGERNDRYIVKIHLNGRQMDEDEEKLLERLSINEIQELEVSYASINEIVGTAIRDLIVSIQDIQLRAIRFAKEFRESGQVDDEKVKFVLIQCRSVIDGLEHIFSSHLQNKFQIKHYSLWAEAEKELTNILQCIFQGRHLSKPEFMSELLEMDLVQALDQWEEVLEKELLENSGIKGIFSLKRESQAKDNGVDA